MMAVHDLDIALIVLLLMHVGGIAWMVSVWWRLQSGSSISDIGLEDCSALRLEPPAHFQQTISQLHELGFQQLGVSQTSGNTYDPPLRAWVLVNPTHEISVEIGTNVNAAKPPIVGFGTLFANGCVSTSFRFPLSNMVREIHDLDYWTENITTNLADAHRIHRERAEEFRQRLGSPLCLDSMDDYVRFQQTYLREYFPRRRSSAKAPFSVLLASFVLIAALVVNLILILLAMLIPITSVRMVLIAATGIILAIASGGRVLLLMHTFGKERLFRLGKKSSRVQ